MKKIQHGAFLEVFNFEASRGMIRGGSPSVRPTNNMDHEVVDLSSFPLLRIDQISRHETNILTDAEAQLSALGSDVDDGTAESAITPFISKLLVHIRKELVHRREQNNVSSAVRCHSSPSSSLSSRALNGNERVTMIRSSSQPTPSFFVTSSSTKSKSSNFRSRAKQAQASLRARSTEAVSRRSEQERQERAHKALEMMQEWRTERDISRKQREELLENECRIRLERRRARVEYEMQIRSSMHDAAEEARSKALTLGCTEEQAIVKAAAAAAKVVDEQENMVFQSTNADSDDDSITNDNCVDDESLSLQLSSLQVDNSSIIVKHDSFEKGAEGCLNLIETQPIPKVVAAAPDTTSVLSISSECVNEIDIPTITDAMSVLPISSVCVNEIDISTITSDDTNIKQSQTSDAKEIYCESLSTLSSDVIPEVLLDAPSPHPSHNTDINDDERSSESSVGMQELDQTGNNRSDLSKSRERVKTCKIETTQQYIQSLNSPGTKYYDIFSSFSSIFVNMLQTCNADIRQKELSRLLQHQISLYSRMIASFAVPSLEEADSSTSFGRDLFYRIGSRRSEVTSIIRKAFTNSSWNELPWDIEDNCWNLMWVWGLPKASIFDNLLVFQRINRFRGTGGLTSKDKLRKTMDSFDFMPLSYTLPHEFNSFVSAYQLLQKERGDNRTDNYWIMKPVGLSRGRGISIVNDISDVSYSRPMVIQRYIQDPLCFMGYKFDLRVYVLVTSFSPLEAFVYKDGLARFGSSRYLSTPESLKDRRIHLTNSSVQKEYGDEIDRSHPAYLAGSQGFESKAAFSWLWKRLEGIGVDTKDMWSKLVNVIRTALVTIGADIPNQPNSFEIFGYDLMFDQNLKCWLIEVNSSPSLACESPLDDQIKGSLIRDTIALVDPPVYDREALADVCQRRLTNRKSSNVSDKTILESDLATILMNKLPRKFGDMPKKLGNYQRICPHEQNVNNL